MQNDEDDVATQAFREVSEVSEAFFKMWDRHSLSMITESWSDNLGFVS
jgi:hypothetical protein